MEHREYLKRLTARLPPSVRKAVIWLLRPSSKWLRIPLGVVLILAGFLGFLPLLGFWMIPLGLFLLAEDIPAVRKGTSWVMQAFSRWWRRISGRKDRSGAA